MTRPADPVLVRGLEERAFNAWPALETVLMAGWIARFAEGYTKRANSVNAWWPEIPVEAALAATLPLYEARRLPLVFRLSPLAPTEADRTLADMGFQHLDETRVMLADLDSRLAVDRDVVVSSVPAPAWERGSEAANRVPDCHRDTHHRMLTAIRLPVTFASLRGPEGDIGWGIAVAERGMVGLFDIVTAPDARRQGVGRRLVTSLMAWGMGQGASRAYLQVVAANHAAIPLYSALGFSDCYRYHYRLAP